MGVSFNDDELNFSESSRIPLYKQMKDSQKETKIPAWLKVSKN